MHFKKGLPLGYYISQWFANYLLELVDRTISGLFSRYVRYMDDGSVHDGNKRELHKLVPMIKICLGREFRLKIKGDWQIFKIEYKDKYGKLHGRKLDFMGFRFTRNNTTLRKRIMLNISRRAKSFTSGKLWYMKHIKGMLSYKGWLNSTDCYNFYLEYVKPYVSFKKLRRIVSKIDRREHRNDRLETRILPIPA